MRSNLALLLFAVPSLIAPGVCAEEAHEAQAQVQTGDPGRRAAAERALAAPEKKRREPKATVAEVTTSPVRTSRPSGDEEQISADPKADGSVSSRVDLIFDLETFREQRNGSRRANAKANAEAQKNWRKAQEEIAQLIKYKLAATSADHPIADVFIKGDNWHKGTSLPPITVPPDVLVEDSETSSPKPGTRILHLSLKRRDVPSEPANLASNDEKSKP